MNAQPSHGRPALRLVSPVSVGDDQPRRGPPALAEPPRLAPPTAFDARDTLAVTHHDEGSVWVMKLAGEADLMSLAELVQGLTQALSTDRGVVVVDVAGLDFCDSLCATAVIEANCNAPETQVVLVGAHGMVGRVFDLLDPAETLARHA